MYVYFKGMIQELIDYNLPRGTLQVRSEVRSLLCLLTKDSRRGTEEMNNIIMTRIASAVKGHLSNPYLVSQSVVFWGKRKFWILLVCEYQ